MPSATSIFMLIFAAVLISACSDDPSANRDTASKTDTTTSNNNNTPTAPPKDIDETPIVCDQTTLVSTAEVIVAEAPIPCAGEAYTKDPESPVTCWHVKLKITAPQTPTSTLDGATGPTQAVVTLRAPRGVNWCGRRWITHDSGGLGPGYAIGFGAVGPGEYVQGEPYGDDLVHEYASLHGFVTVDVHWQCGRACLAAGIGRWTPELGWAANTGGSGLTGLSSRARAIYEWIYANNGQRGVCAHAQSSGTGRVVTALTRYGSEDLFHAVVFDGGPTMNYSPWICDIDSGPLGPRPPWYGSGGTEENRALMDCMYSDSATWAGCDFTACSDATYDPRLAEDSAWLYGADFEWSDTAVGVVMGGRDSSNARNNSPLWLQGWSRDGVNIPGIRARRIVVKQGYCPQLDGSYQSKPNEPPAPCSLWDPAGMPGVSASDNGYDERLRGTAHSTVWSAPGMTVTREVMIGTPEAPGGLCGAALLEP